MTGLGRTSTDRRRAWFRAGAVAAAGATLVLAACSSGGSEEAGASSEPTTTVAEPPPATPAPVQAEPPSRSEPAGTRQAGLPFVADTNPDVSTVQVGYPVLVSVTQGEHDGYQRYVFTFEHTDPEGHQPWRQHARPPWDVRYVPASEAVMDGSGEPVANSGAKAHLRIRFQADMHYADGRSSLGRSVDDETLDMVFGGDFENQVNWFYGAGKKQPFRVFYVGDGRVAVDVVR
jgi:hypothetical protein